MTLQRNAIANHCQWIVYCDCEYGKGKGKDKYVSKETLHISKLDLMHIVQYTVLYN